MSDSDLTGKKEPLHNVKKHTRKHLPTFHNMWHMKVDFHLFKFIFIGILVIGAFVGVAMIANLFSKPTEQAKTASSQASEFDQSAEEFLEQSLEEDLSEIETSTFRGLPRGTDFTYYYPQYFTDNMVGDSVGGVYTQDSTVVIVNPHDIGDADPRAGGVGGMVNVTATIREVGLDGRPTGEVKEIGPIAIGSRESFSSFGNTEWDLPEGSRGWVSITSSGRPVVAAMRTTIKNRV